MALTPFRWIAIVVIGCMMIVVASLQNPREASPDSQERRLSLNEAFYRQQVIRVASRLRLAQLLDSTRSSRAAGTAPPVRVTYDRALPGPLRVAAESVTARAVRGLGSSARAGIDIAFVYDTAEIRSYRPTFHGAYASYVVPGSAGDRCTALVRVSSVGRYPQFLQSIVRILRSQATADQLLGPCSYYREFGMPGPKVASWLSERGWALAADGSWTRATSRRVYFGGRRPEYFDVMSPALWETTIAGSRCAAGQPDQCERVVIERRPGQPVTWSGNIIPQAFGRLGPDRYALGAPLGYRESYLVADMVRAMGRERFAKFWTSSEAVPAAFEQAAGEPLGPWVSQWARAQYGDIETGPSTSGYAIVVSFLLVVLSLFVALRVSARRQFA